VSDKPSERFKNIRQIPYRMHANDKVLMHKLLRDEGVSFQTFTDACVQAFMRGDPAMMKVIQDWKELNLIPKDKLDLYTLSHRERQLIQRELEEIQEKEEERK